MAKNETIWRDLDGNAYNNHFLNNQCYILVNFNRANGVNGGSVKKYLPVYPLDITFSGSTNFTSAEIIGRPGTISGYISTGDNTSRIALHLHRELKTFGNETPKDVNQIDSIVSLIQACQYPKKFQDALVTPIVTYCFGKVLITGKQTTYSTKWEGPKIGNMYMECNIDVQITHVAKGIQYFDDMYNNKPYVYD